MIRLVSAVAATAIVFAAGLASAAPNAIPSSPPVGTSGWAVVNASGRVLSGANVVRTRHLDTGSYTVEFNSDVSQCAYSGTIAGGVKNPFPGSIVVASRQHDGAKVHVATFGNNSNQRVDYKFHLIVQC